MGRPYRHVHPGGSHFEVTTRALQSRFLLPVGAHFRSVAVGIMARAKELYPVELYAFGGLSNHLHWLLGAADVDQLAGFNFAPISHRLPADSGGTNFGPSSAAASWSG